MFKRLTVLLPSVRFLGLLVLVWTTLSYMSTAEFSLRFFHAASDWLGKNAWVGFVVGLGLLAMAVALPELRPWLKLPPTQGERLRNIEAEQLPELRKGQIDLASRLDSIHQALNSVSKLVDARVSAIDSTVEAKAGEIKALHARTTRVEFTVDEHHASISVLDHNISTAAAQLTVIYRIFGNVSVSLGELNKLLWEADRAVEYLEEINKYYPQSDVAKQPFSMFS